MSGESLGISTESNVEKKLGKYVSAFLEYVFENPQKRRCATEILKSLPLAKSMGRQAELIELFAPKYPSHYWDALRKLKSMGVIKLDKGRFKDSSGRSNYFKAYVFNEDFVKLLEKTADGFHNLGAGKEPEEE